MRAFADKRGRTWNVEVNPRILRQVRQGTAFDFFDPTSDPINRLCRDPILLAEVLWTLLRDQAAAGGVGEADFLDGLDLPALVRGRKALCLCACDFLDLDALRLDASAADAVGHMVTALLRDDLALGLAVVLGLPEVPPLDDLRARLLDLAATLRAADPREADALFLDIEAVERQILARRHVWRRQTWHQAVKDGKPKV